MAAKMVAEKGGRHAAAISSHCAALYGLTCLNDSIQTATTTGSSASQGMLIYAGANRISLIIAFDNRPGACMKSSPSWRHWTST